MRVSRAQAEENRRRVVAAASRLFREHGIDGVGVDAVMEAAGLTHGGFYRNFASKDALAAEDCTHAFPGSSFVLALEGEGGDRLAALAETYLSERHRDNRGAGCGFAALGADAARHGPVGGGPHRRRPAGALGRGPEQRR